MKFDLLFFLHGCFTSGPEAYVCATPAGDYKEPDPRAGNILLTIESTSAAECHEQIDELIAELKGLNKYPRPEGGVLRMAPGRGQRRPCRIRSAQQFRARACLGSFPESSRTSFRFSGPVQNRGSTEVNPMQFLSSIASVLTMPRGHGFLCRTKTCASAFRSVKFCGAQQISGKEAAFLDFGAKNDVVNLGLIMNL